MVVTIRARTSDATCNPNLLERLRALSASVVSDSMERLGGLDRILPVGDLRDHRTVMVGQALTVRVSEGDNLAVHQALEILRPGQILAVDAGGCTRRAIVGEILVRYAASRGAAGVVIDGAIRDARELADGPIPVFARGRSHLGPYKNGPGEIGCAVALGGEVVRQGDVLVGDGDGVAVIPLERLSDVVAQAEQIAAHEQEILLSISEGRYDSSWLHDRVRCEFVED